MKPVDFAYARPYDLRSGVGAARRRVARRQDRWRAANRSGRCSICGSCAQGCWSTSPASRNCAASRIAQDEIVIGACVTHSDIEDGRVPDATRGALSDGRGRHRLSRGAQSRHDRRQPDACRSRRPTGSRSSRRSARRWRLARRFRRPRPRRRGLCARRARIRHPSRRASHFCARSQARPAARAGAITRPAASPASSRMRSAPS